MDDARSPEQASNEDLVSALRDANRADAPPEGARARVLAAALPELRVVSAGVPRARTVLLLRTPRTVALVAAAILVGAGLFIKRQQDVAAAAEVQHAAELAAEKAEVDKLMAQLREQTEYIATLGAAVQNAKDDGQRAAAEQLLAEARSNAAATKSVIGRVRSAAGGASSSSKSRPACNCQPGDPLCSCIP